MLTFSASMSGKSCTTNQPRPHHKNQGNNRPRINRPPKALSEARTNKYHALEMEAGYASGCSDSGVSLSEPISL